MTSAIVYATADELKAQPGMTGVDNDTLIDTLLSAASRAVDGYCRRREAGFVAVVSATAKLYDGNNLPYIWTNENIEVTLVEIKQSVGDSFTSLASTDWIEFRGSPEMPDYSNLPRAGIILLASGDYSYFPDLSRAGYSWGFNSRYGSSRVSTVPRVEPNVRVTAKWGYAATVPSEVKQATITLASRWFKRGQSFWADVSANSAGGGELFWRKVVDPDVQFMLEIANLKRALYE